MRNFLYLLPCLFLFACGKQAPVSIDIVPYPQDVKASGKWVVIDEPLAIQSDQDFAGLTKVLSDYVSNWNSTFGKTAANGFPLIVEIDESIHESAEAYQLSAVDDQIKLVGRSAKGVFYGLQTLQQLMVVHGNEIHLPELEITDYPDFGWRSYLLDESRYFKGKAFVMGLLDELAALKINKLHWHLTDDAGWRIEIKKYPKLTSVGAYRDSTQINHEGKRWNSKVYDGKPHGGFYTQAEIKEIIAYAAARNIDIVPEIEMPGHASAAIAAYPWLGVIGKLTKVPTYFGKLDDSYNVTDPKVIQFLHDVLDEVCELFPSEVIHIGGDEVLFESWRNSKQVQAYMKKHQLKTPADLQIRFTNEISSYLEKKGKRMMGWNEILGQNIHNFENAEDYNPETELSKQSVIHFWRGEIPLITDAAQKGYEIVNSLHSETYLDYTYEGLPLSRLYKFNPIPEGLDSAYHKNIIGLGTQMWSEWTPTVKDVEYQTFPRIAAFAEVAWSGSGDYEDFVSRLKIFSARWTEKGINFPAEQIK
ncbi:MULTISPECIES: beta-N-acetylhexosaminidase [unclassified Carboxylicivirga]|uniref:beta-N-acetylhexosaminidase n=1 Tax=Carboxylicivirga TaxID=1628153 RepID=UPI003D32806B